MNDSLRGRRILVTGASSGIGAAVAKMCIGAGASVALLARRRHALDALVAELGPTSFAAAADVTDEGAVGHAVSSAAEWLGGIDGLINVAGLNRAGGFLEGDCEHWREMLNVNVLGSLIVARATAPHMLVAGFGDIVNIGSVSGRGDTGGHSSVYAATKAAITAWSISLDAELGQYGVRVMVVTPGMVNTGFAQGTPGPGLRAIRAKRFAEVGLDPTDVAGQVVHLISQPRHVRISEIVVIPTKQR